MGKTGLRSRHSSLDMLPAGVPRVQMEGTQRWRGTDLGPRQEPPCQKKLQQNRSGESGDKTTQRKGKEMRGAPGCADPRGKGWDVCLGRA